MNETHIMNDFWKFDLLRKTWERLPQDDPYSTQFMNLDLTGKKDYSAAHPKRTTSTEVLHK